MHNQDATYYNNTYNDRSEVTAAQRKFTSNNTVIAGWDAAYNYDHIGNRNPSNGMTDGGINTGYTSNNLNQYTAIANPATYHIKGKYATGTPTVTVDGASQTVTTQAPYFKATATSVNGTNPDWQNVVASSSGDSYSSSRYSPKAAEALTYDFDGNLLTDARWTYTWDLENQLIKMQTQAKK